MPTYNFRSVDVVVVVELCMYKFSLARFQNGFIYDKFELGKLSKFNREGRQWMGTKVKTNPLRFFVN